MQTFHQGEKRPNGCIKMLSITNNLQMSTTEYITSLQQKQLSVKNDRNEEKLKSEALAQIFQLSQV